MLHNSYEIEEIVQRANFLNGFNNKTILITGATGLIGSGVVEAIKLFNLSTHKPIKLVLLVRNVNAAKIRLGENSNIKYIEGSIENIPRIDLDINYIFHAASPTSSIDFIQKPVDVLKAGLLGSFNISELARNKRVEKVLFLSSLEVYGALNVFEAKETDYGLVDWTNVRSSYIESKRASETLFISYHAQYDVPAVVARLPQILTSSFSESDNRVYAQFVRSVKNNKNIILKTKGDTIRNYCYFTDALVGLLILLENGISGEIYNVANEETTCSIKEMAELCIKLEKSNSKLEFDFNKDPTILGYLPTIQIKLISNKLKRLGWNPQINLEEAFLRMLNNYAQ